MDTKQIGEVVRQARKVKGATKKELRFVPMTVTRYENGVVKKVVPVAEHERLALASAMNLSVISELLCENEEITFRSVAVEVKGPEKLIKDVNAELEEWLLSGDTDYLHKAMAVIRAEIKKEDEDEEEKSKAS